MDKAANDLLAEYIRTIEKELVVGNATEHTHRPALKTLIESLTKDLTATNEPRRIDCGAPDFIVTRGAVTIGYIETKDIGTNLDNIVKTDQLKRYLSSLSNLIITDYLEFRWYVDGEFRLKACLGTPARDGKIKPDKTSTEAIAELLDSFLSHSIKEIGTPKELAKRMARLAYMVRDLIIASFKQETETGSLHSQLAAFRDNLIPDLSVDYFADMYAQTISYGMFAARCAAPDIKGFTRQNAAYMLPRTNPFLRNLFSTIAGPGLDDRIAWLVDDLAQVLAQSDMYAVLKDFGKHSGKKDTVVYFYETFLKEYDPKVREMRGVYYTPESVVSYIVRSIDYLLKSNFNRPQGLVDDKTLILDPATGTATFLYMVIQEIYQALALQGQQGMWNNYVAEKLLPRIFGFELLMAPYAVAHLKLGLLLAENGYKFQSDQRLNIYLTNTLEEAFKKSEQLAGFNEYIVEEANAAAEIKKEKPIMVVLGNPPYSGISANSSVRNFIDLKTGKTRQQVTWIGNLIMDYKVVDGKPLGEKNPKWLQADYVKFIRFGQWRIERTGQGILGFITNHSYLDNPTFRGMRRSLMQTFTDIYILNLHGNSKKKEIAPDGSKDENVFDIQQGVSIGIFIKEIEKESPAKIYYADLWGQREKKYQALTESDIAITDWTELKPISPFYLFVPLLEDLLAEYENGWKVTDIFPNNGVGMTTARDHVVIDFEPQPLEERARIFRDSDDSNAALCERLKIPEKLGWNITRARELIKQDVNLKQYIEPVIYRPFDIRLIFYHDSLVWRTVKQIMRHMLSGKNLGLLITRQTRDQWDILATQLIVGHKSLSAYDITSLVPLYLYPAEGEMQLFGGRRPNLNQEFITTVSVKLGLKFVEDGQGDLEKTFGPEDIFNYAYAIFHSPTYRTRYAEFLKIDFPRLPLTSNKDLFKSLANKGADLVSLHLMESPLLNTLITRYPIAGSNIVEKVNYDENSQRVYINNTQYFEGVPSDIWNFQVGGYQVCQKWLKDRKGRAITIDDSNHYQKVIIALKETIRLMEEIDGLIPSWPLK